MTVRPPDRDRQDLDLYAGIDVSVDPGRPDFTIEGAPGAILAVISVPSGVGKDTIIDAMRRREVESGHSGDRYYVTTVTTEGSRVSWGGIWSGLLSRSSASRVVWPGALAPPSRAASVALSLLSPGFLGSQCSAGCS